MTPDPEATPADGTRTPGFRAAVLVVSDRAALGTHEDLSGPAAEALLSSWGMQVVHRDVVSDDREAIVARLLHYADRDRLDLVVTSGGTGLAPRDVTPEATRDVLEREAPGLAEFLRRETSGKTPRSALSRGIAGTRGKTLILNLPGSPRGVREYLEIVEPLLSHALQLVRGESTDHPAPPGRAASSPTERAESPASGRPATPPSDSGTGGE